MLRVPVSELKEGVFDLEPEAGKYAVKVHRRVIGDELVLFDPNQGTEARATLTSDRLPTVSVQVEAVVQAPRHEMPVELVVAIAKGDKPEQAMRDVTALGAEALTLVQAERSVARSSSNSRPDRLRRVAEQVARQCGRGRLPDLRGPTSLGQYLNSSPASRLKLVCAFCPESQPILSFFTEIRNAPEGVSILVGPEGGFSEEELRASMDAGFRPVDLGPYVLRAEVAASATLAAVRSIFLAK